VSEAARDAVIEQHLRTLRLPGMRSELAAVAREAREGGWEYEDFLRALLELEVTGRNERAVASRIRMARFPSIKTMDQIDWDSLTGISRPQVLALTSCEFIEKAHDVVIAGPVGTGKTHLAIAIGLAAAERRMHVAFTRAADLVRDLKEARDEHVLGLLHRRIQRAQLLIVDELGFVPFSATGGELLFNLLSDRHGRRSTLVTTNLAFGEWVQVFGSEKLTTALLDRLCHRAEILVTKGPSYRTRDRLPQTEE
jgi:DNA replication protein DnaC